MTIVISAITKEGIIMGADRLITIEDNGKIKPVDSRNKIIPFSNDKFCTSYWGLASYNGMGMDKHLGKIYSDTKNDDDVTVSTYAEYCKNYFEKFHFGRREVMGIHIAGYENGKPVLRHVFHEEWNQTGELVNENCNVEYHDYMGRKIPYNKDRSYEKYIALFNGDNIIVRSILSSLPTERGNKFLIDWENLSWEESLKAIKLLMATTINLQKFIKYYRTVGDYCGKGLDIYKITADEVREEVSEDTDYEITIGSK